MSILGRFLVEQGAITDAQLEDGLCFQRERNQRIGEVAVDRGVLTPGEVQGICDRQQADPRLFGDIAVGERRLTRRALDELLFFQKVQHTYLGEALLLRGHIDREQYKRLLGRHFALRQSGQVRLRYLQDFYADNQVAECLHAAVSRVARRFAGQELAVSAIGEPLDLGQFTETALLDGLVLGGRRLCVALGLGPALARQLTAAMGQGLELFYATVLVFFRGMLRDASVLLTDAGMRRQAPFDHPLEESLCIRCCAPSGDLGCVIWLEEAAR